MSWFSFKFPFFQKPKGREFKFENYSLNSEHTFENFAVHLAYFRSVPLGSAGGHEWNLILARLESLYIIFQCENNNPNIKLRTRGLFSLKNMKPLMEKKFLKHRLLTLLHNENMLGPDIRNSEILDPKNGWLDKDGGLTLKYGIQVEAIQENGIWKFNFYDTFFGGKQEELFKFEASEGIVYYCDKQPPENDDFSLKLTKTNITMAGTLLIFHSPRIRHHMCIPYPYGSGDFEKFLQIAHGVRLQREVFDTETIEKILGLANYFKMHNVIRFWEDQFIQDHYFLEFLDSSFKETMKEVKLAIQYNSRHYLARLLKIRHCSNRAGFSYWILRNVDFEKTNHELMKMIVKKILYSDLE